MVQISKPLDSPKRVAAAPPGARMLRLRADDAGQIVRQVRAGFPFSRLARFQKQSGLSWEAVSRAVDISSRTLTRRQKEGRLRPDESDRVWRAAVVFDLAIDLFEGNTQAARHWLESPQRGLGGVPPLEFASTEAGAREVENLIGRLEHGVFT